MNIARFTTLIIMLSLALPAFTLPANREETLDFTVYIPPGEALYQQTIQSAKLYPSITISSQIYDKNNNSFNALIVSGQKNLVYKAFSGQGRVVSECKDNQIANRNAPKIVGSVQSGTHTADWGLFAITPNPKILEQLPSNQVIVYQLDSGVDVTHPEFQGRVIQGPTYSQDSPENIQQDLAGHGTHVAGIIAGSTVGVAKHVQIISIKVTDAQGHFRYQDILKAFQYVIADYSQKSQYKAIINMSLSGSPNDAVDRTIIDLYNTYGIITVVAAGNDRMDACNKTPARSPPAITVSATNIKGYAAAEYTNWGQCVDMLAPGDKIPSSYPGGYYAELSGSSMATGFVTGALALLLSMASFSTPDDAVNALKAYAKQGAVGGLGVSQTPNLFLQVPIPQQQMYK